VIGNGTCPERRMKITFMLKTETEEVLEKVAFSLHFSIHFI
jgi:hypothetical protein